MDFEVRDRSVNQGRRALTEERRIYLQLMQQGVSSAEACRIVGINPRTGKRWRTPARAAARRPRPKPGKIGQNTALRDFVQDGLDLKWSPEQSCESLRRTFPDRPEMHVVHETVYQARPATQNARLGTPAERLHKLLAA